MQIHELTDEVITPATWSDQAASLGRTATRLFDLVGWYGSVHGAAEWRKDRGFLAIFREHSVVGFDPQIDDWDPSYARIEAEILATASVIIIRLENNELLNGSLGSIAEIGMALTSAALRGQVVIISIEDGLLTSLNESGAIAQYMMLEMSLNDLEQNDQLSGLLKIHRGDDLEELATISCRAAQQQRQACQHSLDFQEFLAKESAAKTEFSAPSAPGRIRWPLQ